MGDPSFIAVADDEELRRERGRARELRSTQWWKRKRADGVCHWCGRKVAPRELTMDHVIPLIRGGRSNRGNVVPACRECNASKKHRLPWDESP